MFTKFFTNRKLSKWKKNTTYTIPEGREKEFEGKESLYIHRVYRLHDIYVDIYWYIKKDKHTSHEDFVYRRCAYEMVSENVKNVEESELLNAILEFEE